MKIEKTNSNIDTNFKKVEAKNKTINFDELISNADQGDPAAQSELGVQYYQGKHIVKDLTKAVHYFTLAAEQGNADAQCSLGMLYLLGQSMDQDIQKAKFYLKLAATKGHAQALKSLGTLYFKVEQNEKGMRCYQLAADKGEAEAQRIIGIFMMRGIGIAQNVEIGLHYLHLAADLRDAEAQYYLGPYYISKAQETGSLQDLEKGVDYLKLAANQDHTEAQYHYGRFLQFCGIKDEDEEESKEVIEHRLRIATNHGPDYDQKSQHYLKLAAQNGHAFALNQLGDSAVNEHMAAYYYRAAAYKAEDEDEEARNLFQENLENTLPSHELAKDRFK